MTPSLNEVAHTAAMMSAGAHHLIADMTEVVPHWGWLEGMEFISRHAVMCETKYLELVAEGAELPGVWAYEVCEPFGVELALAVINLKREITEEEAQAILGSIVRSFLSQDGGSDEEVDGDSGQGN